MHLVMTLSVTCPVCRRQVTVEFKPGVCSVAVGKCSGHHLVRVGYIWNVRKQPIIAWMN